MFDEIVLEAGFQYDKQKGYIFGLEDFGLNRNLSSFANQLLMFMARGIWKKYKRTICFYFEKGTTKTRHLIKFIKEVV